MFRGKFKKREEFILINDFTSSCFAYEDGTTGRSYPLIIDWNRFTQENLDHCYNEKERRVIGFRLTLKNTQLNKEKAPIITKNWDGVISKRETIPVSVHDEYGIYEGELKVEIQNAK